MPRFSSFGIWENELAVLLTDIQTITSTHKKFWHDWFCGNGFIFFHHDASKSYLAAVDQAYAENRVKNSNPVITKEDIIQKYTAGFAATLPEFLKIAPATLSLTDKARLTAAFNTFKTTGIANHQAFFEVEAKIITNTKCPIAPGAGWMMHRLVFQQYAFQLEGFTESDDEVLEEDLQPDEITDPAKKLLADDIYAYIKMEDEFLCEISKQSVSTSRHSTFAVPASTGPTVATSTTSTPSKIPELPKPF
jgi:hypothetical protein